MDTFSQRRVEYQTVQTRDILFSTFFNYSSSKKQNLKGYLVQRNQVQYNEYVLSSF